MKTVLLALCLTAIAITAARAGEIDIDQSGQQFSPDSVTVKTGDMLHFTNQDDVTHNIHVLDSAGNSEDLGKQKPGETLNKTFDKPGHYDIRCAIHPRMKMSVDVQ